MYGPYFLPALLRLVNVILPPSGSTNLVFLWTEHTVSALSVVLLSILINSVRTNGRTYN